MGKQFSANLLMLVSGVEEVEEEAVEDERERKVSSE